MFARSLAISLVALSAGLAASPATDNTAPRPFVVEETTIAQVHDAMRAGTLTCRTLVETYLERIERYNRQGPTLNAVTSINPQVLVEADRLDAAFKANGLTGPLHCVPVILKDNIETAGWETTAGSLALRGFVPEHDATAVARLKAAGALMLAKGNMSDLALNALTTVNRVYGPTRNPYDLDRVPAGSSGGTAVAIAANFALVGLGTDTGSSVRGPAAHTSLVGVRPTMGLISRAGLIPLDRLSDTVGPIARTVEDASLLLDVLSGYDPEDPSTEAVRRLGTLSSFSSMTGPNLSGLRIGILSQAYQGGPLKIDERVTRLFARALNDLTTLGAEIVTDVTLSQVPSRPEAELCQGLKFDLNAYLASRGDRVPVHSLTEILHSGRFDPSITEDLRAMEASPQEGPGSPACAANAAYRAAIAASLGAAMDRQQLDALVYPTWSQLPQPTDQIDMARAGQTLRFATAAGFPAITVPMGFAEEVLPVGLSILGRGWSEQTLIRVAHAYEQATGHRRPPVLAPPIACKCDVGR